MDGPKIDITKVKTATDPIIFVYQVEVEYDASLWAETFGSTEQLIAYLRGLEAGFALNKVFYPTPTIP